MILLSVLLGIGCRRPSSEPIAEPDPSTKDRSPAVAWLAQPRSKAGPGYKPPSRSPRKPEPEPEPTSTLEASACEYVCADVHACVLEEGREPSAAASIELGCLDACVGAPEAFATCERPGSIGADTCGGYLECVRETWPSGARTPVDVVVDQPAGNGCDLACAAFARCYDASIDEAEECGRQCRAALTEDLQRVAGECARLDGCEAIESCVQALPGA
ncbi:MAG TPA: hypothetical protein VM869_35305 [Enhygromyxa sp.]|nr:hypothetical protein [Enhygromyxa sp.]